MVDIQQYNMLIEKKDLYKIVTEDMQYDGYTIGLHGIADVERTEEQQEELMQNILNNGLVQRDTRTLYGTVRIFGNYMRDEDQERLKQKLGYYEFNKSKIIVIVAIPTWFYGENESIFMGNPKPLEGTSGNEVTTLADFVTSGNIPSEFIYGYYIENEENNNLCELVKNPNHVCQNGGYVSSEMMEKAKSTIQAIGIQLLALLQKEPETISQEEIDNCIKNLEKQIESGNNFMGKNVIYAAIETLNQYRFYIKKDNDFSLEDMLEKLDQYTEKEENEKREHSI